MADIRARNVFTGAEQSVTEAQLRLFPHSLQRIPEDTMTGTPVVDVAAWDEEDVADEQPLAEEVPSDEDVTSEREDQ